MSHTTTHFFNSIPNPFAPIRKKNDAASEASPAKINNTETDDADITEFNPKC